MARVTRTELITRMASRCELLDRSDVKRCTQEILKAIADALCSGRRVEIRGFGVFDLKYRRERLARNPKTGSSVFVPSHAAIYFKPGLALKDRVFSGTSQWRIDDEERGAAL